MFQQEGKKSEEKRKSLEEKAVNDQHYQELKEQQQQSLPKKQQSPVASLQPQKRRGGMIKRLNKKTSQSQQSCIIQQHLQPQPLAIPTSNSIAQITQPNKLSNFQQTATHQSQQSIDKLIIHLDNHQQEQQLYDNIYSISSRKDGKQTDYLNNYHKNVSASSNNNFPRYGESQSEDRSPSGTEDSATIVYNEEREHQNQRDNLPQQVRITPQQSTSTSVKAQTISYESSQKHQKLQLNTPSQIFQQQEEQEKEQIVKHSNPIVIPIIPIQRPLTQVNKNSKKVNQLSMQVKGMKSQVSQINKKLQRFMEIHLQQNEEIAKLKEENRKLEEEKSKLQQRRLREEKRQEQVRIESNMIVGKRNDLNELNISKSIGNTNFMRKKATHQKNEFVYNKNNLIINKNNLAIKQQYQSQLFALENIKENNKKNNKLLTHKYQIEQVNNHHNEYPDDLESQKTYINTQYQDKEDLQTKSWRLSMLEKLTVIVEKDQTKLQSASSKVSKHDTINNHKHQHQQQQQKQHNQKNNQAKSQSKQQLVINRIKQKRQKKHTAPSEIRRFNNKETVYIPDSEIDEQYDGRRKIQPQPDQKIHKDSYECAIM